MSSPRRHPLTTLQFVALAIIAGAVGSAAQTVVFQKAKFLATSTAADAIQSRGGITAGSGNVPIVSTAGKIPALSSTYFASLSAANLTALPSDQLVGTIDNGVQDLITRTGTVTSGAWAATFSTSVFGSWDTSKTCGTPYTAATDVLVHVDVGTSGAASITTEGITIGAGGSGVGGSGTMGVRKGQTWTVNLLGGTCGVDVSIYVLPIGG
jgi:hypothetical protein